MPYWVRSQHRRAGGSTSHHQIDGSNSCTRSYEGSSLSGPKHSNMWDHTFFPINTWDSKLLLKSDLDMGMSQNWGSPPLRSERNPFSTHSGVPNFETQIALGKFLPRLQRAKLQTFGSVAGNRGAAYDVPRPRSDFLCT